MFELTGPLLNRWLAPFYTGVDIRERFSCRSCQTITQPPAPFHVTPRAMFGPHFLACLAFNKFGLHQPLNSQRDRLESQGIPLSLSTLADQIGAIAAAVKPIFLLLEAHTLGAGRLHGDDTTVPRLAKYKTDIARMWTYVCDDAPFAGGRAPSALFYYSRDRRASTAGSTLSATGVSFRPTITPATMRFMTPGGPRGQSHMPPAGPIREDTSSNLPILPPRSSENPASVSSYRRLRSRRCNA